MRVRRATSRPRGFVANVTRETVLAETGFVLRNPLRQAVGTMFHRLPGSYVFAFPTPRRVAITNLFVFQAIDILWLDARGTVLACKERFPPFALSVAPNVAASVVIELPEGTIKRSRTRVGDTVTCSTPATKPVFIRT